MGTAHGALAGQGRRGEQALDAQALEGQGRAADVHQGVDGADLVEVDALGIDAVNGALGPRDAPQGRQAPRSHPVAQGRGDQQALEVCQGTVR